MLQCQTPPTLTFGTIARTATIVGNLTAAQTITMEDACLTHLLKLGGTINANPAIFNTIARSGSTVEHSADGTQTVFTSANYANSKFSGSNAKSL